jgi:hypothetical protein
MPYRLWHILGKLFVPVLFAGIMAGILLNRHPGAELACFVASVLLGIMGLTGGVMGVLMLIGRLRMRCPFCGESGPAGGNKRDGIWMTCERCGYIHTAGPAGLRIVRDPVPPE